MCPLLHFHLASKKLKEHAIGQLCMTSFISVIESYGLHPKISSLFISIRIEKALNHSTIGRNRILLDPNLHGFSLLKYMCQYFNSFPSFVLSIKLIVGYNHTVNNRMGLFLYCNIFSAYSGIHISL